MGVSYLPSRFLSSNGGKRSVEGLTTSTRYLPAFASEITRCVTCRVLARQTCALMNGKFFLNAWIYRVAFSTPEFVYQTISPSFLAPSINFLLRSSGLS